MGKVGCTDSEPADQKVPLSASPLLSTPAGCPLLVAVSPGALCSRVRPGRRRGGRGAQPALCLRDALVPPGGTRSGPALSGWAGPISTLDTPHPTHRATSWAARWHRPSPQDNRSPSECS
ncbi:unnamed protein product [Rangifer tarandus platyrhynchus]|uniref:Uncharacterized protein n=1 Tax=Rangifer tarandus platyrhynchus TaxID=3082113 RepID=A0ACB1MJR7_RANTA